MSKKNFSTAGMDLLGLRQKENTAEETAEEVTPAAVQEPPTKTETKSVEAATKTQPAKKQTKSPPPAQKFVRKSYYVTPAQHKALKIKAANGETAADKDISAIIRSAIDLYLAKK